jgi:hypothetical protein
MGGDGMEMDVGIQRRPTALDRGHGPAAAADSVHARPAALGAEHRAHEDAQHGAAQTVIVGQRVAQPMRQRQHPLAHRQVAEHAVDEVRRALAHAPA